MQPAGATKTTHVLERRAWEAAAGGAQRRQGWVLEPRVQKKERQDQMIGEAIREADVGIRDSVRRGPMDNKSENRSKRGVN